MEQELEFEEYYEHYIALMGFISSRLRIMNIDYSTNFDLSKAGDTNNIKIKIRSEDVDFSELEYFYDRESRIEKDSTGDTYIIMNVYWVDKTFSDDDIIKYLNECMR